jgi:AmmeMemoRadiSam system protein A
MLFKTLNRKGAKLMPGKLTTEEKNTLLRIARRAMSEAVRNEEVTPLHMDNLSSTLQKNGASFVTLTINGDLRGCIGALEAYQPLALDVQEHAIAAALQDYRFPRVEPAELESIHLEISWLSEAVDLVYGNPMELPKLLHTGVDGVILQDGFRKATFLPQVWQQLPDPVAFLGHLCIKMGATSDLWQKRLLKVKTYQVEEFSEEQVT